MHFCNICNNMLYIRLLEEASNSLIYYCRNCGEIDSTITKDNICILQTDIVIKEKAYLHEINEYTKLDPTLPRTNNIKCPNQSCLSNKATLVAEASSSGDDASKKVQNDVIYIRYDDVNMKYIYICTSCDKIWKTSDQ